MAKESEEETLEDEVIDAFYKLGNDIRKVGKETYVRSLKGILFEEASKYLNKNKDKETHEIKWENDEQIKKFSDNLWDKTANHIAEHYLKMDKDEIKKMRAKDDPDNPDQSLFDALMAGYIGSDKESFFDSMKGNEYMTAENFGDYIEPLYSGHVKVKTSRLMNRTVKTPEDSKNLLQYTKLMKKHNPDLKIRLPKYNFKDIDQALNTYASILKALPETYHPSKPDTYTKKK